MAKRSGVFTLTELSLVQRRGNWPTEAFTKPPYNISWPFGYYAGGPSHTGVTRLDFSTDDNVTSIRGPISFNSYLACTTSSSSGGYVSGNESGGRVSSVCKIDYASDTSTASPKGPVNQIRGGGTGVGNLTYGWHCNGQPALTQVDRIDYSNDTATASPRGDLSFWTTGSGSSGNNDYGYIYHGSRQGAGSINSVSHTDRIDYSNDSVTSSPKGKLTASVYLRGATGNANYGYCAGGKSPGNNAGTAAMARMDYANDTATMSPKGPLSVGRAYLGSTGNSDFGYWGGGYNPGPGNMSHQDRLTFANDTATCVARGFMGASAPAGYVGRGLSPLANAKKPTSPLTIGDNGVGITTTGASLQYDATTPVFSYPYGYWGGGYPPGPITTVSRIDYSNDTATASPKGNLSAGRYNFSGMMNNQNFGYMGGGYYPGNYTDIHRLDFSNDTLTMLVVSKVSSYRRRGQHSSIGNKDYGYFTGGSDNGSSRYSTVDRLDFSNDTATAAPKGPLGEGKANLVGTGNQNFGYAMGGSPAVSTIRRIDFSNDTVTAANRGPLASTRYGAGATGTRDFGYIMGGYWPGASSRTERINYSNDTTTSTGNLQRTQGYGAAVGNSAFGYVTGGNSNIERLDFSNDTAGSTRGQTQLGTASGVFGVSSQNNGLAQPLLQNFTTVPPSTFGYFVAGEPGTVTTSQRIDFSNDTATALRRGSLQSPGPTGRIGGMSGQHSGWFAAGGFPGGSHVRRIEFANDTALLSNRGKANVSNRTEVSATFTANYGYFGFGRTGPGIPDARSDVERIDYNNDTVTASPKANGPDPYSARSGMSSPVFGYYAGGIFNSTSRVDRLDFANDTTTMSTRGDLTRSSGYAGATGNRNYGWFGGGNNPNQSTVDRIDYSNDTTTASSRGPLAAAGQYYAATGNQDYGYFAGGYTTAAKTNVTRIDYSSDTGTSSPKGDLAQAVYVASPAGAGQGGLPFFPNQNLAKP